MIHVFREKDFFLVLIRPSSWSVNQFPTRVLLLLFMDHSYNNNNKWRLHAIFSDPRVWINRGSTMDQHGSTWITRPFSLPPPSDSWLMRPPSDSWLMRHASGVMRPASDSWLMRHASHASDSWLMRHASDSWLMRHASGVMRQTHGSCVRLMAHASCVMRPASWLMAHGSCVRRPTSHVPRPFSHRRPLSVMTTTGTAAIYPYASPFRFAPIELYGTG